VLGFNCSDDADVARDLMRKKHVDYPTILDGSDRAQKVFFDDYRGSGVPLNYVIDREGRVAASWYGWSEKDPRLDKVLRDLGISSDR
jgi:peroxiredoxin